MTHTFRTQAFHIPKKGGIILTVKDPTATLDVWSVHDSLRVLRWPRSGQVRAWMIASTEG